MKEQLIKKHFGTRKDLEWACEQLGLPTEGSRESLVSSLMKISYKKLIKELF